MDHLSKSSLPLFHLLVVLPLLCLVEHTDYIYRFERLQIYLRTLQELSPLFFSLD